MNLNPIFVRDFDHDGWPLCPKCKHPLCVVGQSASNLQLAQVEGARLDTLLKLTMQAPLLCHACGWITPTTLDPRKTMNLAAVTPYIHPKWFEQGHGLPRIQLQHVHFDANPNNPHAKCWVIYFGYN